MKVNCLSCGHKVEVDDAYDNYEGPIKCFTCNAMLEIKTEDGYLKTVKILESAPHASAESGEDYS